MRVIETSLGEDLSLFSAYLWNQRIRHRVFEERGRQVLEVADLAAAGDVERAYADWREGRLQLQAPPRRARGYGFARWCARFPGVVGVLVVVGAAFPFTVSLSDGQLTTVAAWLTIVDLRDPALLAGGAPEFLELLAGGAVWRWLFPIFIHFSALHLLFNATVVVYLGCRIETNLGAVGLWSLVGAIGLISNLAQYLATPNPLFGGLSGVGYGLLGFILVAARLRPDVNTWRVPPAFSGSLLFFLVVFSTGITEHVFDGVRIANTAHWAGLVAGALASGLVVSRLPRGAE